MRLIARWIPGFVWVQFVVVPRSWLWEPRGYWNVRGIAYCYAVGPFRLVTMRKRTPEQSMTLYRKALPRDE
jgi:hypothetical protein